MWITTRASELILYILQIPFPPQSMLNTVARDAKSNHAISFLPNFLFFSKRVLYASSMQTYMLFLHFLVSTLKDQLEDLKKVSQNSQLANEKLAQLQKQVSFWNEIF